jgi:hypothetical protein
MAALFESNGALEISVFHADEDGNGTNPLRLASAPRLIPPQEGPPVDKVTVTVTEDVLVESCVETAVMIADSAVPGAVKVTGVPELTPVEALSVPPPDGFRLRFTVFANDPVPVTVGVQVAVCVVVMLVGLHANVTLVIVGAADVTVIFAEPEMFVKPA